MLQEIKQPKYTVAKLINPFWEPLEENFTELFGLILFKYLCGKILSCWVKHMKVANEPPV